MPTSQKLFYKYNDYISEFVSKNPDVGTLKNFIPINKVMSDLKFPFCEVSLYNVEEEKNFLPFIEYLVIQNFELLDVFSEVEVAGNVRILRIENNELLQCALWILFSFFGNTFQISVCILHVDVDVETTFLRNTSLVNEFVKVQKNLGENCSWKIFLSDENVIRYEMSLRNEELQNVNELYLKSANIPFSVLFLQSVKYLKEMYYQKAFFLCDSQLTYPLFKRLNHLKLDLNNLIVFEPFLLVSCKKKYFRLFWSFYSLCCFQYWSFKLPAEVCILKSDYFHEKNPFIVSFYLKHFLDIARLSNDGKNRKLVVQFFQNLDSFAETKTSQHSEKYFSFSNLVVDFEMKRDKSGIYFEIELDFVKFFQVFNPSAWFSISYRGDIWEEFLKYALQQGFSEKQMDFYMQQFFLFYSHLSLKDRYNSLPGDFSFLWIKDLIDPVLANSKRSKENKNKNKIYLTMICFLVEKYFPSFVLLSYEEPILSYEELLSMVDIPFQKICLRNRDESG